MSASRKGQSLAPLSVISSMFPLPPASPMSPLTPSANPPLSGPPSAPLPNPPAQSRFSDHEAFRLLSSSSSVRSRLSADSISPPTPTESRFQPPIDVLDDHPDPALPNSDIDHISQKDLISSVDFPSDLSLVSQPTIPTTSPPSAPPKVDPMTLHRHIRSARSRSASHKQALQTRDKGSPSRPASPDIQAILSSTPRPKRGPSFSNLSSSSSRSKPRAHPDSAPRRVSEGAASSQFGPSEASSSRVSRALSDRSWIEDEFTDVYRIRQSRYYPDSTDFLEEAAAQRLERQLEGADGSDSDSDLDLHTPLPDLMVRHGLLSPRSKLLAANSRPSSKASFVSAASVVTKSGIIKDERDTAQRRSRHRDNRHLMGGLGLTTGLGWSDSEDEDAPSALTKRISSLTLSRSTSHASIRSKTSTRRPAMTRTQSSGTLSEDRMSQRKSPRTASRQSQNKTLRSRTSGASATTESYTTSFHLPSRVASPPVNSQPNRNIMVLGRKSSSTSPLSSSRPSSYESGETLPDSSQSRSSQAEDTSSSSTISVPAPVTPNDDLPQTLPLVKKRPLEPVTRLQPPGAKLTSLAKSQLGRPRAFSSGSCLASETPASGPPPTDPLPPLPAATPASPRTPRPLRLPQSQGRSSLSAVGGERTSLPKTPSPPRAVLLTKSPSVPTSGANSRSTPNSALPRPRTGTGMAYRSSSMSRSSTYSTGSAPEAALKSSSSIPSRPKPIPI